MTDSNLLDVIKTIEDEFPHHGWLVRSQKNGGYFSNIITPDFQQYVSPEGSTHHQGSSYPSQAHSPSLALLNSLTALMDDTDHIPRCNYPYSVKVNHQIPWLSSEAVVTHNRSYPDRYEYLMNFKVTRLDVGDEVFKQAATQLSPDHDLYEFKEYEPKSRTLILKNTRKIGPASK